MRLENFKKNIEGLDKESKEYEINCFDNEQSIQKEYEKTVEKLALYKIKNDILFEGRLGSSLRHLTSLGLTISKEIILKDIEKEIYRQKYNLSFDNYPYESSNIKEVNEDKKQINSLFNNIFNEEVHLETKETITNSSNNEENSLDISQELEVGTNDIIQDDNFDKVYEIEIKRLTELKKSNNPNYEIELNNSIRKISSLTYKIPNIRSQIESDINFEINSQNLNQTGNSDNLNEDNKKNKDTLISQIINKMNQYGELSFGEISISERLNIMQGIKDNLSKKSSEDLEYLLMSYEDIQSNKRHR